MLENLSRFRMSAIIFVVMIVLGSINLVGSEDENSPLMQFANRHGKGGGDGSSEPSVKPRPKPSPTATSDQGALAFADDNELIDSGEGFDPMPESDDNEKETSETNEPRVRRAPDSETNDDEFTADDDEGEIVMIDGKEGPFY